MDMVEGTELGVCTRCKKSTIIDSILKLCKVCMTIEYLNE